MGPRVQQEGKRALLSLFVRAAKQEKPAASLAAATPASRDDPNDDRTTTNTHAFALAPDSHCRYSLHGRTRHGSGAPRLGRRSAVRRRKALSTALISRIAVRRCERAGSLVPPLPPGRAVRIAPVGAGGCAAARGACHRRARHGTIWHQAMHRLARLLGRARAASDWEERG